MIAFINGNLLDISNRRLLHNTNILVEENRITRVSASTTYPEGTEIIDINGLTVMPGLIDCHLHLGGFVIDKPGRPVGRIRFFDILPFFCDYLRSYKKRRALSLENGVTTIRSAGDLYPHILKLRDKIASGKISGPRIFACGPIFTAPGGHPAGTIYKKSKYIIKNATRQFDDPTEAREEVDRLISVLKRIVN